MVAYLIQNIYPNPTVDIINIDIAGSLNFKVNLYDLEGTLLKTSSNTNQLQLNTLPVGTYLLEIKDQKTSQKIVERIVVDK